MKKIKAVDIDKANKKNHLIEQAYKEKDKNLMLMQLLTKLLYNVPEASKKSFATYHTTIKTNVLGILLEILLVMLNQA